MRRRRCSCARACRGRRWTCSSSRAVSATCGARASRWVSRSHHRRRRRSRPGADARQRAPGHDPRRPRPVLRRDRERQPRRHGESALVTPRGDRRQRRRRLVPGRARRRRLTDAPRPKPPPLPSRARRRGDPALTDDQKAELAFAALGLMNEADPGADRPPPRRSRDQSRARRRDRPGRGAASDHAVQGRGPGGGEPPRPPRPRRGRSRP